MMNFILFFGSVSYGANVPVKVGKLTLSFQAEERFVPKAFRERLEDDWQKFCEDFAKQFVVGKGPQGRGIFSKTQCLPLQYVSDAKEIPDFGDAWRFIFTWSHDSFGVSMYYQAKGKGSDRQLLGQIDFPKELKPDTLFDYREASYYVASRIYRRLPAAWSASFHKTDGQWQLPPLQQQMMASISAVRKVGIFALAYNTEQKTWNPTLFAVAQPVVSDDSSKDFDRTGTGALDLHWILQPHQAKARFWAQEIINPLEKEPDLAFLSIRDKGAPKNDLLENYALEGLKADSVALKYAIPFPKGSTVVSQTPKIEFDVNIGKGSLDGFMLGVEYSPRKKVVQDDETYSYTWNRTEIGYSFNIGQPQSIDKWATRFRLTPKVGFLSLDAYFPLNASENLELATAANFHLKRQLDFGGEFDWEVDSLNYRIKVWAATHFSGYLLAGSNPTKISNQRAGGDVVYDFYRTDGGLRFGILAFGYIDWVTLQKETVPDLSLNLATTTSSTASGASYNVTYIGTGLSLTW